MDRATGATKRKKDPANEVTREPPTTHHFDQKAQRQPS
jgi:hypothetical protein